MFSTKNTFLLKNESLGLNDIYFPINSHVFTFVPDPMEVQIFEIYNIDRGMEQMVKNYGTWNSRLIVDPLPIYERRKNLMGYVFSAETMPEPPYVIVNFDNLATGRGRPVSGIWGDVWLNLENTMNFSTKISASPDNKWGSQNEDGTWNGIIKGLQVKRTQIGLASFSITFARGLVADFSPSIMKWSAKMFIKSPTREASWTTYVQPFDTTLWLSLLLLLVFMMLCLSATYLLGPEKHLNPDSFSLINSFILVWGSQIGQGSWIDPKSFASKIIFFISFLLGVCLVASYSAALMSYLTIGAKLPFKSLEEMLASDYQVGSVNGSAILDGFLRARPGSIHETIANKKIRKNPSSIPDSIEEGLIKAKQEKYAFVWSTDTIYGINQDNCDFVEIPDEVSGGHLGIGFTQDLPHAQFFDFFINKMKETGQMKRILRKWLPKPREDCNAAAGFLSLGLDNLISAFAMFVVVLLLAIILALFEKFVFTKREKTLQISETSQESLSKKDGWSRYSDKDRND